MKTIFKNWLQKRQEFVNRKVQSFRRDVTSNKQAWSWGTEESQNAVSVVGRRGLWLSLVLG